METQCKLIIFTGLPGSGKSTLAEVIAKKLGYTILSVDPIESSIIKSGISRSFETGYAAYLVVETLANEQLGIGHSVIVDAVSPVKEARQLWTNISKKHKCPKVVIECMLSPEIHKARIEARVRNMHGIPEVSWRDVEKQKELYLPWDEVRLLVNTDVPVAQNVEKILAYINQ